MLSLTMRLTRLAPLVFLLAGCAEFNPPVNDRYAGPYSDPYAQSDFDELLVFGANMAHSPAAARSELCRSLLKRQKESPDPGVQLHLLVGRLLSDTCGDIPRIIEGVNNIPFNDQRLTQWVSINTEALKRMNNASKRLGSLEQKQKTVQSVLESKEIKSGKKDEARLLREKLEAIRSMEKQLDESGDAAK